MALIRIKKIIAVYGPNGSGKTTMSIKIARELAKRKNNVVVIFADNTISSLPLITDKIGKDGSLSNILDSNIFDTTRVTNEIIRDNYQWNNNDKNTKNQIAFLGYLPGEYKEKYVPYGLETSNELLSRILKMDTTDYVIVDCNSDIPSSNLSISAFNKSHIRICVGNADYKFVEYQNTVMKAVDIKGSKKQIVLLNNIYNYEACDAVKIRLGGTDFSIPNDENLHKQYLEGNIMNELDFLNRKLGKTSIKIAKELKDLATVIDIREQLVDINNEDLLITEEVIEESNVIPKMMEGNIYEIN